MLLARDRETAVVRDLLQRARAGDGGALVVRGEAGVGKTALLEVGAAGAEGFDTVSATGVEFEMELAFAGVHALCAPLLDRRAGLPTPQCESLEIALGLRAGPAPEPVMVGLALLGLLSQAAEDAPVLCVVDDAQWLDRASAQAVSFASRRVGSDRVAVLFGLRDPALPSALDALPQLRIEPLGEADARSLLLSSLRGPLDGRVVDRLLAEAQGNPLVLRELASSEALEPYAGAFAMGRRDRSAEPLFRSRVQGLPAATQLLLLVAAAEPTGDPLLLWRAAAHLGLSPQDAAPAEERALLVIDERVRFPHPVVRSATYRGAPAPARREAHAALAVATDPAIDPDRRAWHRAQGAAGPDAEVAEELIRSADRARTRGGMAAAAAFLARAAALTPDAQERTDRTIRAAEAMLDSGAPAAAGSLIASLPRDAMPEPLQAHIDILLGLIAYGTSRGADAAALLRRAAVRLEPLDARVARDTHVWALLACVAAGPLGDGTADGIAAALAAPPPPGPRTAGDDLLDGMALVLSGRREEGTPLLRRALDDPGGGVWMGRPTLLTLVAVELWDLEAYESVLTAEVARLRSSGSLTVMPGALSPLASSMLPSGRLRTAAALLVESDDLADAIGVARLRYCNVHLAALRGDAEAAEAVIADALRDAVERGEGLLVSFAHYATALLCNGRADYTAALAAAERAATPLVFSFDGLRLRELIEAAVHLGERDRCEGALARLRELTRPSATPWSRGNEAICTALLADGPAAEGHWREALAHLTEGGIFAELGRAELLYGQWLRREDRRREARTQLRSAYDRLSAMGADGFAERARRELRATGDQARRRPQQSVDALTPQELQVAHLVATGATSKEVAGELFLSPRTVDAHLRGIFRKLGITSRRQLRDHALP